MIVSSALITLSIDVYYFVLDIKMNAQNQHHMQEQSSLSPLLLPWQIALYSVTVKRQIMHLMKD